MAKFKVTYDVRLMRTSHEGTWEIVLESPSAEAAKERIETFNRFGGDFFEDRTIGATQVAQVLGSLDEKKTRRVRKVEEVKS